jgi:HD-GYP domain-containing protein (c-di-GMP phosphodiesterase class II)
MQSKVSAPEIQIGMFVSSLDRPWIDTPFMLQGFLIESSEDIRQLRQYCEFVYVDWSMSTLPPPASIQHQWAEKAAQPLVPPQMASAALLSTTIIRPLDAAPDVAVQKPAAASSLVDLPPTFKAYHPSALSVSDNSSRTAPSIEQESQTGGLFAEITGKFKSLLGGKSRAPAKVGETTAKLSRPAEETPTLGPRPDFIPANISLAAYAAPKPIEEEVTPAINAHKRVSTVLTNLVQDIKSNKNLVLQETEVVVKDVVDSMVRNPDAMMWVTRLRSEDEVVYGHGLQVAVYLVALGRHLGLPKNMLEQLCTMGLLLDIGKIKLPKDLLLKRERLTAVEFGTVKSHVRLSLEILKETPDLSAEILRGIAQHHERENGSGYPAGLSGDEISLFGRMAGIADSFAALTNPRTYAAIMPAYEALQTVGNFNSGLYQASMVEQFIQAIGVFPVGSMVELSTGEVAVVIGHSKVRRLKPRVLIISDSNKRPAVQPTTLDLLYQSQEEGKPAIFIQRGLPIGAYGLDAREYYLA